MTLFKLFTPLYCICLFIISVSLSPAQTLEVRQEEAQKLYFRGVEEARKENLDAAIDFYSKALNLNANYSEAFNNRGVTYLRKRLFDLAVNDFSNALALRPKSAGLFLNRSSAYYGKGDYAKAHEDIDRAFELNPNWAEAWATRGKIHRRQKEYQTAINDYTKAIEIQPISRFFSGRCLTYYDFGKYENTIADCSEAVSLKPNDSMSYYYRGLARIKLEQKALAINDLRKSVEINPNFREAQSELEALLKNTKY